MKLKYLGALAAVGVFFGGSHAYAAGCGNVTIANMRVGRDSRNFRQKRPNSMIQRKNLNYQSVGLGNVQPAVTVVVPAPSV
ncbi:hypothetical protein [Burkholderia vietnamiensis]|uniref:hypothetical protein n=1 Tax=Burkholderia vietnamiensis TaxID=60552 RepID=UPI0012DB4508|nr:hypothetical protein [Burkholderia vietnamiensis]